MDSIPLLKAKLVVPEIPGRVLFSGRIKKLNITGYRTVVITAPAGFGKTTAVLLSLRKDRDNMRWYRMEKEDSFLPVFYAHLIEALFSHEDKDTTDSARSLASIGSISEEYALLNAVICQDAWARYQDSRCPVYLIFDDFQNVVDNASIVETVNYMISNLPPNMRIIVMSRVDTGVRIGKLALNKEVLLIGEDELRFAKEEIMKLASDIYKIKIDDEDMKVMHNYSEGWIAGITLLLHTYAPELYKLGKLPALEDTQKVFKYLLTEAFDRIGVEMMKTLASISILPDFTCDDLKAVFDMENASELIALLEKNNIYIQKTVAKTTSYRFHSLFRSALQSVLDQLFTQAEIADMYVKASQHYKNAGIYSFAIRFLLLAGKTKDAVETVTKEGLRLMNAGDFDKVVTLVQEVPEELMQNDPYLLLFRGTALMNIDFDESYTYLHRSLLVFKRNKNIELQANIVFLIISMFYKKNDVRHIKSILTLIPKVQAVFSSAYGRKTLLLCSFFSATWADRLGLAGFLHWLIKWLDLSEPMWEYMIRLVEGATLYRLGRLEEAEAELKLLLEHPTTLGNDSWKVAVLSLSHNTASQKGDMETSQKIVSELAFLGEKYNSDYARNHARRFDAYNKYQLRDVDGAIKVMGSVSEAFAKSSNPIMAHITKITKYLWESESSPSPVLVQKAYFELTGLLPHKSGQGFSELGIAMTGIIHKDTGEEGYDEAEKLLKKAYNISRRKKALLNICGTAMHLADLYYRKKAYRMEEKYLKIWGNLAANNGYIYFREMNYPTLVRVCARCIEKNIRPDYMQKLLGTYFNAANAANAVLSPKDMYSDPKAFIASCSPAEQKTNIIRVKLFGSFRFLANGVEIGEAEWKTRKICGILKYILAHQDKPVSRETLTVTFWPESDSKAAQISLRVALSELRKILARFGMAFESEDALIAEGKNGFYLCSRNTIKSDVERFSELYKKYRSGKLSNEKMRNLLAQMVELYDGDFLEEDSYDEWTALSREHYKAIFIEVSHKLAELYMANSELEQAEMLLVRHMKVDPFDEKACSMLMYAYDSSGRKNQAASLRRQFEKRFESEMGVKPDLKYP